MVLLAYSMRVPDMRRASLFGPTISPVACIISPIASRSPTVTHPTMAASKVKKAKSQIYKVQTGPTVPHIARVRQSRSTTRTSRITVTRSSSPDFEEAVPVHSEMPEEMGDGGEEDDSETELDEPRDPSKV